MFKKAHFVIFVFTLLFITAGKGDTITGSGTANKIPKFNGTATITDSIIYESSSKIGIGISAPTTKLELADNVAGNFVTYIHNDNSAGYGAIIAGGSGTNETLSVRDYLGNKLLQVQGNGNVGIGTTNPTSKFFIEKTVSDTLSVANSALAIFDSAHTAGLFAQQKNSAPYGFALQAGNIAGSSQFPILLNPLGSNVGIGTANPTQKLEVAGTIYSTSGGIKFPDGTTQTTAASGGGFVDAGTVVKLATSSDSVGIGTDNPSAKLTVKGGKIRIERNDSTVCLELGDGLDYAEGFNVSEKTKDIEPGTVLVIDEKNPGKLAVSGKSYDTKVAGIAAGANNLKSGVRLGVGGFDCDVALAGRVYCNVDTTKNAIQPGDLLTTSNIPGYAMKAVNHSSNYIQGAVLGKAMEGMEKGKKGQILVLVTLQ